jgi:hypothetical protein
MDLVASLITGGVISVVLAGIITLVRIAIAAERRRADDWRTTANTSSEAYRVLSENVGKLLTSVEQLAVTTRETQALVRQLMTPERAA